MYIAIKFFQKNMEFEDFFAKFTENTYNTFYQRFLKYFGKSKVIRIWKKLIFTGNINHHDFIINLTGNCFSKEMTMESYLLETIVTCSILFPLFSPGNKKDVSFLSIPLQEALIFNDSSDIKSYKSAINRIL